LRGEKRSGITHVVKDSHNASWSVVVRGNKTMVSQVRQIDSAVASRCRFGVSALLPTSR